MAITVVQSTGQTTNVSATNISEAFGSPNVAGNALILYAYCNDQAATYSVTDSPGGGASNTWTQIASIQTNNTATQLVAFRAFNCGAGANTVTLTKSGSAALMSIFCIAEINGVNAQDQFGTSVNQTASAGGVYTCASVTTLQAIAIIISGMFSASATPHAVSPFSVVGVAQGTASFVLAEQDIVAATNTYTPSFSNLSANQANCSSITFSLFELLTISGALGASGAGATVTYTGTMSGSVVADGSGNYVISGLINGTYTITPSLTGFHFSPTSQNETVADANITGVNFTTASNTVQRSSRSK